MNWQRSKLRQYFQADGKADKDNNVDNRNALKRYLRDSTIYIYLSLNSSPLRAPCGANKGRPHKEKHVFFRALPEKGGGGLHMPEFFGPFFLQSHSP